MKAWVIISCKSTAHKQVHVLHPSKTGQVRQACIQIQLQIHAVPTHKQPNFQHNSYKLFWKTNIYVYDSQKVL